MNSAPYCTLSQVGHVHSARAVVCAARVVVLAFGRCRALSPCAMRTLSALSLGAPRVTTPRSSPGSVATQEPRSQHQTASSVATEKFLSRQDSDPSYHFPVATSQQPPLSRQSKPCHGRLQSPTEASLSRPKNQVATQGEPSLSRQRTPGGLLRQPLPSHLRAHESSIVRAGTHVVHTMPFCRDATQGHDTRLEMGSRPLHFLSYIFILVQHVLKSL